MRFDRITLELARFCGISRLKFRAGDILSAGGCGQHYLRETICVGVFAELLANAEIMVIFAH